ncbi:hypothetical protein [Palleronia abyssalis]|uniref:Uncharacterized protein n=1 Tax=Palleronia abyssalis TaxID=1501240 RepID=A0A2R8C194_9RHOB|nr:hypothetical protein [Palleronia abyssalis]SPJ26197.1 hypothetical protein PAA8504_04053 [Palleronia abyssalis]
MIKSRYLPLAVLLAIAGSAAQAQQLPQPLGDTPSRPAAEGTPQPFAQTATSPPVVTPEETPVDPAKVASLRAAYEDLRRREAEAASLSAPATPETSAARDALAARAEELDTLVTRATWEADNMNWFVADIRQSGPVALPEGTPANMTLSVALATVQKGALSYHSPPPFRDETLQSSFGEPSVVLRVAEAPGVQLVWVPKEGFAFMSGQSLEIFR